MGFIKYSIYITVGIIVSVVGMAIGVYRMPERIDEDEFYERCTPTPEHQNMEI